MHIVVLISLVDLRVCADQEGMVDHETYGKTKVPIAHSNNELPVTILIDDAGLKTGQKSHNALTFLRPPQTKTSKGGSCDDIQAPLSSFFVLFFVCFCVF